MAGLSDTPGLSAGTGLVVLEGGLGSAGLSGGGGGFSPFSLAIFAAFTTPPADERKTAIDACVKALVASGVWDSLDAYYPIDADEQASTINWIAPGTFTLTNNGATFLADRHWVGNGADQYLDSGFNPTTAPSPHFVQDSACMFASIRSAGVGGVFGQSTSTLFLPDFPLVRINQNAGFTPSNLGVAAFWSISRSGAAAAAVYKNGALFATDTEASIAPSNANAVALRAATSFGTHQVSSFGFGGALDDTKQAALAAADLAYRQTIGAVA